MLGDIISNDVLWLAVLGSTLAQILKGLTHRARTGEWDVGVMYQTGGMPSSHAAMVSALATGVGLRVGFGTPLFAAATVFALIVIYDAAGVRRAAGEQARILNQILAELFQGHPIQQEKLQELLGHTRMEVTAGIFLGVGLAVLWMLVVRPLVIPAIVWLAWR